MAYKVIILYQLYMPSYFLGTFTEYPFLIFFEGLSDRLSIVEPGAYECPGFRKILVGIAA